MCTLGVWKDGKVCVFMMGAWRPPLQRIRATDPQIMAQAMAKAKLVHAKYAEALLADISYAHKNDLDQVGKRDRRCRPAPSLAYLFNSRTKRSEEELVAKQNGMQLVTLTMAFGDSHCLLM
jgi:hypothetical protein